MRQRRPLRRAHCALLWAAALAAAPHAGAQAADAPALAQHAAVVAGLVPPAWAIEQQHHADLNLDGRPDALLLLRPAAHATPGRRSPPRWLVVALGAASGYAPAAANGRLIPQVDLASQEDPLGDGGIVVRPGGFEIKLGLLASAGSYQMASLRYVFRYEGECFRLVGYDRLETHRATLATQDLHVDFVAGSVVRETGNAQSAATQVQRERLADNPRRCLQGLGSAAEFNPL